MDRRFLIAIIALSAVGFGIATYSFLHHQSFVSGAFCDLSTTFNCDVVNKGPFSVLFGIPVALLGMIGYAFMGSAAALRLRQPNDKGLHFFSLALVIGGLGFTFYLTGLEAFVLRTWCILCLTSQGLMLSIFFLTPKRLMTISKQ